MTELGDYVASFCIGLSEMARSAGLPALSFLLDLTHQEAERVARNGAVQD